MGWVGELFRGLGVEEEEKVKERIQAGPGEELKFLFMASVYSASAAPLKLDDTEGRESSKTDKRDFSLGHGESSTCRHLPSRVDTAGFCRAG